MRARLVILSAIALAAELGPAALDAKLSEAIAAIGWPAEATPATVAVPIAACPGRLAWKKARQQNPDIGQALISSLISGVTASGKVKTAAEPLCGEGKPTVLWGAYRAPGAGDGYLLAIGDSGRTVSVYKSFVAPTLPIGYAVTLHDLDGRPPASPISTRCPVPSRCWTRP